MIDYCAVADTRHQRAGYGMPVYVDAMLELNKEIVFNAGKRVELMRLAAADYA